MEGITTIADIKWARNKRTALTISAFHHNSKQAKRASQYDATIGSTDTMPIINVPIYKKLIPAQ